MEKYDIDFVIPWVDDRDPIWRTEKQKYWNIQNGDHREQPATNIDANNEARFRDWQNLKYWFRAVEKFAPWVHKIYFVTCGHFPEWLNTMHPKLVLIKHEDYIPKQYLPTFSANPIEINFHRIPGLSEHFVYFNDDMFLTNSVMPEDFYQNGLPKEMAVQYPLSNSGANDTFQHMLLTMAGQINAHFDLQKSIRANWKKWFHPSYGKLLVHNICLAKNRRVSGLIIPHVPTSLRKTTMNEVWSTIGPMMEATSAHKFRTPNDITQYIFRYWEIMKGSFDPVNVFSYAEEFHVGDGNIELVCEVIRQKKYKMICVNDDVSVENVELMIAQVKEAFDSILPDKSEFEL